MEALNIHTLLMAIRGLSNEITVRGLSAELGISYSTLARCKNGVWPRSITMDAMRGVIDGCRERHFEGDGVALAESVLLQLRSQGLSTGELERALAQGGYDAFVADLLAAARTGHGGPSGTAPGTGAVTHSDMQAELGPAGRGATVDGRVPEGSPLATASTSRLLTALPIAVILLVGLFNLSLSSLFSWVVSHRLAFFCLSLLIALSPALAGCAIDVPLAWHRYHKEQPDALLTARTLAIVARDGGLSGRVPGAGRFDLSPSHQAYALLCNVSGMLTYTSLLYFLLTLPDFEAFFEGHEWIEYFKVGIVVASLIASWHTRDQLRHPARDMLGAARGNPDTYLPTRAHVLANCAHLVWTNSLLIVLILSMIAYGIVRFRTLEAPTLILWPYLHAMAFFAYSSISPQAVRERATGIGTFLPGVAVTSAGVCAMVLSCYLPSWGTFAICAICSLVTTCSVLWMRARKAEADREWIAQGRGSGSYILAATASLVFLLVVGMVTSAFA